MIKIAFVINYISNNGPSNVVRDVIKNLDHETYSISLITLFNGNDSAIVQNLIGQGVTVYECKKLSRGRCLLGDDKEFREIISRGTFNIIHTHGFVPDILSSRLKTSAKRISTLHNNMFEDYLQTYGRLKAKIFVKLHFEALKKMECCVGCSESVYRVMRKYLQNVTYVRNGIKPKIAKHTVERVELNIPDDAVVFVYSGNLTPRKNVQFLISKFVQHHNKVEYLLLIGDGSERKACEQLADDHVILLGFQDDPAAFYNISDFYVSASRSEGFSISVLEAMSCGLGLFLSDIPSHREVISEEKEIYLGEYFSITDDGQSFKEKLIILRENYMTVDKKVIEAFQQHYLSDIAMTYGYKKIYQKATTTDMET